MSERTKGTFHGSGHVSVLLGRNMPSLHSAKPFIGLTMQRYLIRHRRNPITGENVIYSKVAHLWLGSDTACKMASTGGLSLKKYMICNDYFGLSICQMCRNVTRVSGKSKNAVSS